MRGATVRRIRPAISWIGGALALGLSPAMAQNAMPPGFVYLRDVDPTIAQDIRYASQDNFTGRPITGYDAPECILKADVAAALKRVQAELKPSGVALKVYDCYRPHRAVRAMAQWAHDGRDNGAIKRFFPRHDKSTLFSLGYLAGVSRHSTGTAVDLTLVEADRPAPAAFNPSARYAPCVAAAAARAPDDSVDMGTGYDCFDATSQTRNPAVAAEAQRWRQTLVAIMTKHGFRNYHREWWHFSYSTSPPPPHFDFPIRSRGVRAQAR